MLTDLGAMKLALHEGSKGLGFVTPNPAVGCVIVDKNGEFLAKGYHRHYGNDHAEIDALIQVKNNSQLDGATFYVTLEPCAHEGKTPSCAKTLAKLPIKKVVYGLLDPNPLVSGKGLDILRAAGIQVEKAEGLDQDLEDLAEIFLCNQRNHMPFVTLKVATSLDGQVAHVSGESRWITGEKAREEAHRLRAYHEAILVGKNTFLHDNPSLNIRHEKFVGKKNRVIILDARGELLSKLANSNVLKSHLPQDIILAVGAGQGIEDRSKLGIQILPCAVGSDGHIDLQDLLRHLFRAGIHSILVEGGAAVISAFLQKKLANRLSQFISPQVIGAPTGIGYTKSFKIADWNSRLLLRSPHFKLVGEDIFISGRID